MPLSISTNKITFPIDRQGTLVEIDALPTGAIVDGIFYLNSPTVGKYLKRVINGTVRAVECGIYPTNNTSVNSANLQNALNNTGITHIVFDTQGVNTYNITGTITVPAGKVIEFKGSNVLNGPVTINGGIFKADYRQQIFTSNVIVNPQAISTEKLSVIWFGAAGNGTGDDQPAIQAALNTMINNYPVITTVYLPSGTYNINNPLLLYKVSGVEHQQVYGNIMGDAVYSGIPTSQIVATFKDRFALGIQIGKGNRIENLAIYGGFTNPFTSDKAFYESTFAAYVDPTCRDNQYSPYAGIVIDPFANSNALAAANQYPNMGAYYTGAGSNGGSTGVYVNNCMVSGFVVGFITSPSGLTRNAELIKVERIQFINCKSCIAITQDQEKCNTVEHLMCWGYCHTVIIQNTYGAQLPGHWEFRDINIAGHVNRFIYHPSPDYFPIYIRNFYSEGLGTFGTWNSYLGSSIMNGEIGFYIPPTPANNVGVNITMPLAHLNCSGISFRNIAIRTYGAFYPVIIKGNGNKFDACYFEVTPYSDSIPANSTGGGNKFFDCYISNNKFFGQGNYLQTTTAAINGAGDFTVTDPYMLQYGVKRVLRVQKERPTFDVFPQAAVAVTQVGSRLTFTSNANDIVMYGVNQLALYFTGTDYYPIGIISAVNTTTYQVTVEYCITSLSGNYNIGCAWPFTLGGRFIGDFTNGSNVISNVVFEWGNFTTIVGTFIKVPLVRNDAYTNIYSGYVLVTAANSTAKTITVSQPFNYTTTAYPFTNDTQEYIELLEAGSPGILETAVGIATTPSLSGTVIRDGYGNVLEIVGSGFPPSATDPRKFTYLSKNTSGGFNYINSTGAVTNILTAQLRDSIRLVTASTAALATDYTILVNTASGNVVITITPGTSSKLLNIKKTSSDANTVTITAATGTIDGLVSRTLGLQNESIKIHGDGTNYYTI